MGKLKIQKQKIGINLHGRKRISIETSWVSWRTKVKCQVNLVILLCYKWIWHTQTDFQNVILCTQNNRHLHVGRLVTMIALAPTWLLSPWHFELFEKEIPPTYSYTFLIVPWFTFHRRAVIWWSLFEILWFIIFSRLWNHTKELYYMKQTWS